MMFSLHEAPGTSYEYLLPCLLILPLTDDVSLVHLGMYPRGDSQGSFSHEFHVARNLTDEFPRARIACWWLGDDTLSHMKDGGLSQQGDKLLGELRNMEKTYDSGFPRPIIFVCWGFAGGLVLKEVDGY